MYYGNSGTTFSGVTNQYLVWIKDFSKRWNPCLRILIWLLSRDCIAQVPRVHAKNIILKWGIKDVTKMSPDDILIYSSIIALFRHHQRIYFMQQILSNTETYKQTLCNEWETGKSSPKWEVNIKSLTSDFRKPYRKDFNKNIRTRDYGWYQENKVF